MKRDEVVKSEHHVRNKYAPREFQKKTKGMPTFIRWDALFSGYTIFVRLT